MRTHLSEEKLLDALHRSGEEEPHLHECAECRARLEQARAGLALALEADVPEPSPLYWQGFRREVERRIDEPRGRGWRGWLLWPAVAALAASLLWLALPQRGGVAPGPPLATLPAWTPLQASDDDVGLSLLQAVAGNLDAEAECPALEECVSELSETQSRMLAEMLRRELPGRQS